MGGCLLCLEGNKSFKDCILVDSAKWKEQNMKHLIDTHLWPMKTLNPSSWICTECGDILQGFNKFYERVKSVQLNFTTVLKDKQNSTNQNQKTFLCSEDSIHLEFKDNLLNENASNENHLKTDLIFEQPLPTEFLIDDTYIKSELEDNLCSDDRKPNKRKKSGRPIKDVSLKIIEDQDDPLMKIKKMVGKNKNKSKFVTLETNDIKDKELNLKTDKIHNSPVSLDIKNSNESETDMEHLDDERSLSEIRKKRNHRNLDEKTLKEYDQIIAENFKIFCNICQFEMENFLTLRRHFKMEHKQRGYARCCKRNFFTRSLLVDHIHVHLNPEYFKCHQCNKVFSDRSRLLCHKKLHDDDSKLDKCNICGKLFADKGALKKHVPTHSSQKLFPCTICGKYFTNSFILNHHIEAVHQNKFVQICDICGKLIRCPTAFASHMEKHEVKTSSISCDVCGLLLTNKEGLKRHKNSQHPEGGKKEHTCHICSKVSPTQRALKSHIRSVHEQGFDFKCSLCEKSFKRPAVLKEHMATHTGTALYTCLWCPRTFISNGNMYNHRKNAHPKEWQELKRQKYAGNYS